MAEALTKEQIIEKIARTEKSLANETLKNFHPSYKDMITKLKGQLKDIEAAEKEKDKGEVKKIEAAAAKTEQTAVKEIVAESKEQIQAKIERAKKNLKNEGLKQFHASYKDMIAKLEKQLETLDTAKPTEKQAVEAVKAAEVIVDKAEEKVEAIKADANEQKQGVKKITLNKEQKVKGCKDYDVAGYIKGNEVVDRVVVPDKIKKGDIFNVYYGEGSKAGCEWKGDVKSSLEAWIKKPVEPAVKKPAAKPAKKAAAKPVKKAAAKKKVAAQPAAKAVEKAKPAAKTSKPDIDRRNKTVTINGRTLGIDECEIAIELYNEGRIQKDKATNKFIRKVKRGGQGAVIGGKIASAAESVVKNIPANAMKNKSATLVKLKEMQKTLKDLAKLIDDILGGGSATKEIKEAIAVIHKFMIDKLKFKK